MDVILNPEGAWRLRGARDSETGMVFFPYRPLAADGSLRPTEEVCLSAEGTLYSWTRFGGVYYGQIDLPEGVRLQCTLTEGPQQIDAPYRLAVSAEDHSWRFARV